MTGKLICMNRSGERQVNAHTTYGVFKNDEDASWFAEDHLGWSPGSYSILNITVAQA